MSDVARLLTEAFEHQRCGRIPQAAKCFEQVLRLDGGNADAMHELGILHSYAGRNEHALRFLEAAAHAAPHNPRFHTNLGVMQLRLAQAERALASFDEALKLEPNDRSTIVSRGAALRELGRIQEAAEEYRRAFDAAADAATCIRLGAVLQDAGRLDEAIDCFRRAQQLDPSSRAQTSLLLCMNYHDRFTPEEIFAEHSAFGLRFSASDPPPSRPLARDHRLRIGYLSPDFKQHSVSFFIWPILMRHDRTRFEITCYSDVAIPDPVTAELQRLPEHWRPIAGLPDERVAQLILDDQLDILIELTGHTGNNRLPMLARRLAPIQITYLGYPNTTGLRSIDYRLTDAIADPPGQTEHLHTEQLLRLPDAFFCYVTPADLPDVNPLPALSRDYVTFAVFTNFSKIRPASMELWARILRALPASRLVIQAKSLNDPLIREETARFFTERGIDAKRVELRGWVDFPVFITLFKEIDIVLDTFPFNGHTTSCHAIWLGAPVLSQAGNVHRSRMGLSLMTNLGLSELVARDADDYVRIAVELAGDLPRLAKLRGELRSRMRHSPLCDSVRFTRNLENAFTQIAAAR